MVYATVKNVEAGFREFDSDEIAKCLALLEETAVLIDAVAPNASDDAKRVVSCRVVRRAIGAGDESVSTVPIGATQGSVSALGYTQSWTVGSGSTGEIYLSKVDKKLLGMNAYIGAYNPLLPPDFEEGETTE